MLDQLNEQKDDVFDLASLPESSSDNDGESVSDNNKLSPSDNNASTSNNGVTGTSDINAAESNSNDSSHHAKIVQMWYKQIFHLLIPLKSNFYFFLMLLWNRIFLFSLDWITRLRNFSFF